MTDPNALIGVLTNVETVIAFVVFLVPRFQLVQSDEAYSRHSVFALTFTAGFDNSMAAGFAGRSRS